MRLRSELILDVVDELVVQVEETFEEVGEDEEVARAVGEVCRGGACVGDALTQVGDIGAQRGEAFACDVCSDEAADEQAEQRVAFDRQPRRPAWRGSP